MNEVNRWILPDTTVSALVTIRPLSITILEKYEMDPFILPLNKVSDLCRKKGISPETFIAEIEALEIPSIDSAWSRAPLYWLLDYLTREHSTFINEIIPAINRAFWLMEISQEIPERYGALISEWHAFAKAMGEHIAAEECFLFPKILRYDYCARHGKIDPDFYKGSVRVFAALQLHKNEQGLQQIIQNFIDLTNLAIPVIRYGEGSEFNLKCLLESLEIKLQEHSRLEKDILVPMASALEKQLYDRFISGNSEPPHRLIPTMHVTRVHELF